MVVIDLIEKEKEIKEKLDMINQPMRAMLDIVNEMDDIHWIILCS